MVRILGKSTRIPRILGLVAFLARHDLPDLSNNLSVILSDLFALRLNIVSWGLVSNGSFGSIADNSIVFGHVVCEEERRGRWSTEKFFVHFVRASREYRVKQKMRLPYIIERG